jgi:dTDP-4-amino-4,6-dideoxygalactose transaminase
LKDFIIPVFKPSLPKFHELSKYLGIIDKNRIYTNNGPILQRYELALADFLKVDPNRIVLTANATIALEACVQISKPLEWIVPDFTFSATASAVLRAGKKLRIADVDIKDWSLDCNSKAFGDINKNTVGILPVAPFGAPIEFEKWSDFKNVVIDGAASLGNLAPNFNVMQQGWFVVYSLHATKIFPAAEGGLIVTQNEDATNLLKKWINFGFNEDRISDVLGSNGKMSEYHAAIGLTSLEKNVEETKDWLKSLSFIQDVNKYTSLITKMSGVRPYWIVQFPNAQAKLECTNALSANGIQSRSWWKSPLSEMPAFRNIPLVGKSQVSSHLSRTTLGLPMFRGITTEQLQHITDII